MQDRDGNTIIVSTRFFPTVPYEPPWETTLPADGQTVSADSEEQNETKSAPASAKASAIATKTK